MEALVFETKILENGIIKIPELKTWYNKKIKIFIIEEEENITNEDSVEESVLEYRELLKNSNNQKKVKIQDIINIENELTNDIS
ncbi:MAG: hypothetical protein JXL97_02215 [Bacteroidales bacterium]|nr:hypothetical protein [Bacteroidales bacterium]